MNVVESTVWIKAHPEQVFDLLIDTRRHPEIVFNYIAQDEGPTILALGDTFTWRMKNLGMTFVTQSRMSTCDRPHQYQEVLDMRHSMTGTLTKILNSVGGGTQLTWRLSYVPKYGALGRAVDRLIGCRTALEGLEKSLALVKRVAERESKGTTTARVAHA